MTPLDPGCASEAVAFLHRDLPGAVFPLLNLTPAGLPMRAWVAEGAGGGIAGFLGLTAAGMALPVGAAGAFRHAPAALAGAEVTGMLGRPAAVAGLVDALGLDGAPVRHDAEEVGFALDLEALVMPDVAGRDVVPLDAGWRDLAVGWRAAYEVEVLGTPAAEAAAGAGATVDRWIAQGSHRMLIEGGAAVAMAGFNADLGEVVQVGGVWVAPEGRGRGRARAAVALHLAQARARGVRQAVLFAVSDAAGRAYAAIGFRRAGEMRLVLFAGPQRVPA